MKGLRGTRLDPFGFSEDRKLERGLLADYEAALALVEERLTLANHALAVVFARYPEKIRGFGYVKAESARIAVAEAEMRRAAFLAGRRRVAEAAE